MTNHPDRILSKREVIQLCGLSATTLWRECRAGRFPKPVPISKGRVGWLESAILSWIAGKFGSPTSGL